MMEEKQTQTNAANEKHIEAGKNRARRLRERELGDLRSVLSSVQGRRFFWRLLSRCKTFETIWEASARIHYNAGAQDIGHYMMAEVVEADEKLLFQMMTEAKEYKNV